MLELFECGLKVIDVLLTAGSSGEVISKIEQFSQKTGVRVVKISRPELERICGSDVHQGVAAFYQPKELLSLEELIDIRKNREGRPLIALDGVEDPRNLGAIIRSAEVLGAGGVIIRKKRAAGITPLVVKTSAGGALWLPISEVNNLNSAFRTLKENDYWIFGLDVGGDEEIWDVEFPARSVFVLGGEGKGIARLTRERCDSIIRIPQLGKVESLNVSVSASLVMGEWLRQNRRKTD